MAYRSEKLWEIQYEVSEIHRKIFLLLAEGTPKQQQILLKAQKELSEWEKKYVHEIRKMFEG